MNIFDCPQRDRLFGSMKMGWYNVCPIDETTGMLLTEQASPYALYHCQQVSPQTIREIKQASEAVGSVLMQAWSVIRNLDEEALLYYGFPQESIRLVKYDTFAPFCMRLDWCWNEKTGVKKVVETNPQTPSFWFECTVGNHRVAEHFGLRSPDVNAHDTLKFTLNQHVKRAAVFLDKPFEECEVVFTTLNNAEDLGTMQWLSSHVHQSTIMPLEFLRIQDGKCLFDQRTGKSIDILFMWYPLEWAIHDTDENGERLWPALEKLILERKVVIVNFGSAFALQPKSVFALISDLGLNFFSGKDAETIFEYFPKTSLNTNDIGDSYFAKPILGREGEGGFAVNSGKIAAKSSSNNLWYTEQAYIYQELLEFPKVEIVGEPMTAVWGAWLYNNGFDKFVAGGLGMRVSEGEITDNIAYWCPIGC
ncbi:glutathionylspermidine synthase [Fischerella thermalis CCMEE 5201]|nr:glutathionylspermidine synthase [Fischerella thermalis CCMEE 5201]